MLNFFTYMHTFIYMALISDICMKIHYLNKRYVTHQYGGVMITWKNSGHLLLSVALI